MSTADRPHDPQGAHHAPDPHGAQRASDAHDAPGTHDAPDAPGAQGAGDRAGDRAGDDERCLALLLLLRDGRPVEPELAAWARAHVAAHAACATAYAELVAQSEALAAAPARRAQPGFTDRVLAELDAGAGRDGGRADVLPFVRRLAVAAGLALAVTLGVGLARPAAVQADGALQRQRHAADHFRRGPFGPPRDIGEALRERLQDPDFGKQPVRGQR